MNSTDAEPLELSMFMKRESLTEIPAQLLMRRAPNSSLCFPSPLQAPPDATCDPYWQLENDARVPSTNHEWLF